MKTDITPPAPQENLIRRLSDPQVARYIGRTACLRIEVMAALETGKPSLYSIAKEYNVSRQALTQIARRARIMLERKGQVD